MYQSQQKNTETVGEGRGFAAKKGVPTKKKPEKKRHWQPKNPYQEKKTLPPGGEKKNKAGHGRNPWGKDHPEVPKIPYQEIGWEGQHIFPRKRENQFGEKGGGAKKKIKPVCPPQKGGLKKRVYVHPEKGNSSGGRKKKKDKDSSGRKVSPRNSGIKGMGDHHCVGGGLF